MLVLKYDGVSIGAIRYIVEPAMPEKLLTQVLDLHGTRKFHERHHNATGSSRPHLRPRI